jgi:ATP-dependent DNA ligase
MNVWEFLGHEKDHRAKPVQLVKHVDEVPESKKEVNLDYLVQTKYDGVYCMIVMYRGHLQAFGRTGKKQSNMNRLLLSFNSDMSDGVYIGEVCNDKFSLEQLSGVVNPNRVNPLREADEDIHADSYIMMHDLIPIKDFIDGECETYTLFRLDKLRRQLLYQDGKLLIQVETKAMTIEEAKAHAITIIEEGHEGIVIKFMNTGWVAGHKGWRSMKIVRGVDYDLECIAWEEGTGKYEGKVANLVFRWKDGKVIKAMLGKGWTHDMAECMYNEINYPDLFGLKPEVKNPIGEIFQVYALQESSKGVLRLPKVGEMRHDKDEADV